MLGMVQLAVVCYVRQACPVPALQVIRAVIAVKDLERAGQQVPAAP